MTGDHHGRTSEKATLLVRAADEILGTHNPYIGTSPVAPVPATTVRVITTGGLAGWQVTLIALRAALAAAAAAVLLDRKLAGRHRAATTA
jgi:hypothetical protein